MLSKLSKIGLNLSDIARLAKIDPAKLLYVVKAYSYRSKSELTPNEQERLMRVLKKLTLTLNEIIEYYE